MIFETSLKVIKMAGPRYAAEIFGVVQPILAQAELATPSTTKQKYRDALRTNCLATLTNYLQINT